MKVAEEGLYRLRLADGFLAEARQDLALARWRSCVDNSQLSVENAAKVLLALLAPVGRTHNPAILLRQSLADRLYPQPCSQQVERVAECAELLGPAVHVQSDYGDEVGRRTPWELFDGRDACKALTLAEEAAGLARSVAVGGGS